MLNALLIIFVIAKILGLISWSWWIVFSPAFIAAIMWLLGIIFAVLITK